MLVESILPLDGIIAIVLLLVVAVIEILLSGAFTSIPPLTMFKFPPFIFVLPLTLNEPLTVVFVFTTNPKFGEITACAEPDLILSKSPKEDALIFVKPLPFPINVDADTEPLNCEFAFICNVAPFGVPIWFVCTAEPLSLPTTLTDSEVAVKIDEPLTTSDTLFILF